MVKSISKRYSKNYSGSHVINLISDLCKFKTAVVADENELLFKRILLELPGKLYRFPANKAYNGWIVPQNWQVKKAKIFYEGEEIFDGLSNSLAVGYYSHSFQGKLDFEELKKHIVTNPNLPTAYMFHCMWQYRPWEADWVFSIPHNVYRKFGSGLYDIDLQTQFESGEMIVGEFDLIGETEETIVLNAHSCHPHMANDGFSGVAVLIRLMQWLTQKKRRFSYRLIVGPEHLGTVFYLNNKKPSEINKLVCGFFVEMIGTEGEMKLAESFTGEHDLDRAFSHVLRKSANPSKVVSWRKGAGNDETVWEAPGYEVPFVEFTRCEEQFKPFKEYHSSLDTPELMNPERVEEMLGVLQDVIYVLENNAYIDRKFDGLICLSNPDYNLYKERPDPTVSKNLANDAEAWGCLQDSLFRYFDGNTTILDIAEKHNISFLELHEYIKKFEDKGLVSLRSRSLKRKQIKRLNS